MNFACAKFYLTFNDFLKADLGRYERNLHKRHLTLRAKKRAPKTQDIWPRNEPARNRGGRNCIRAFSNHERRVRNPIYEISFRAWAAEVRRYDNIIPRRGTIRRGRDRLESSRHPLVTK